MKKLLKSENFGVIILIVLTLISIPFAFSDKAIIYLNKATKVEDKNVASSYNLYDDEYDDSYVTPTSNYTYLNNSSSYNNYDNTAPAVEWTTSHVVYIGEIYNLMSNIYASHQYYGDVTNNIEIIYNNLIGERISDNYIKVTTPGEYTIVYKACNYKGSNSCRTVNRTVTVRDKYLADQDDYYRGPVWSNTSEYSCSSYNYNCNTYSIPTPTATDPYSKRSLTVRLISGEVNNNQNGTYVLIYEAYTEHNVRGTIPKTVIVTNAYGSGGESDNSPVLPASKYISNYYTNYYDDGLYSGTLKSDNNINNNQNTKFVDNYEWVNKVTYTYKCTSQNSSGTDGWEYVSTDTPDNHPTVEYNQYGYTGTLSKKSFYCKTGCTDKLIPELGTCNNIGETKQIYRTWVGVYYGEVSLNNNLNGRETYSGYVYLKR